MKIISHAGITKPSFLLVSYELPILTVRKPQLVSTSSLCISSYNEKKHRLMIRSHYSATGRTLSSSSTDLRLSKEDKFNRNREQVTSASLLYTHPSLLQMNNERIANHTRVYEFLRSIGVVPDELDGLELPVTIEVMQERVDFLHKLGLTIEDTNNYPLVLGCSV
ncbi:Mitochondrial transcription termination factor family protein [Forsythia ovata]|uniref:Mitochondrial transcription termination factor family protein n=1 Tax=Forsythia ovata TaxID=205694 RepID=A0ABD1PYT0_9LAMI